MSTSDKLRPSNKPHAAGSLRDGELVADIRRLLQERVTGGGMSPEALAQWDRFYATYSAVIRRFVRRCVRIPPQDEDDCVQEVWLAVLRELPELALGEAAFSTWLFAVVRHKTVDAIRRRKRAALSLSRAQSERLPGVPIEEAPVEDLPWVKELLTEVLRELKGEVAPSTYQAFLMRHLQGLSVEQTSRQLNLSPAAIRAAVHRCRLKLRDKLAPFVRFV